MTCDVCKNDFDCMLKEQTKTIEGHEIIRTYMECPRCKAQYDICYDDMDTLALKKQIRKETTKLKNVRNENKYRAELKKIEKKQKRLEHANMILQSKYKEKGKG